MKNLFYGLLLVVAAECSAASFDGDIFPDLVYGAGNKVVMLENTGSINTYTVMNITATAMAVGDLDGDENADLIVSNVPHLYWVEVTGDNAFSIAKKIDFSGTSTDIEFLGNELFSIKQGSSIIKIISNGPDAWSASTLVNAPAGKVYDNLEIADIDDDGKFEMLVTWDNGNDVGIDLYEQGALGWVLTENIVNFSSGKSIGQLAIGDIDGDQYPDVMVGIGDNRTYYFESDGTDNTLGTVSFIDFTRAGELLLADIDEDGLDDAIVSDIRNAGQTVWFDYNDVDDGTFSTVKTASNNHVSGSVSNLLVSGDWDIDGDTDLLYGVSGGSGQGAQWGEATGVPVVFSGRIGWVSQWEVVAIDPVLIVDEQFGGVSLTACEQLRLAGGGFDADLSGDCVINLLDFSILASQWGNDTNP